MTATDHATAGHLVPRRAIIDIGSNTVRLVIYGGPPRAPVVLFNEKVTARLGKGMAETGRLSAKAQEAALAALARYRALLDLKAVDDIQAVATAAVRDAGNGPLFLERVRALGFAARLLSGEEEAETSALGVIGAFPLARGVVADLGGGSLELVDVAGGECRHGVSLPLGTLRLPALREGGRDLDKTVKGLLAEAEWSPAVTGATLYLVGGSLRQIARYALHHGHSPTDDPHGLDLSAKQAATLARAVMRAKPEGLAAIPGVSPSRLSSLPDAAALLIALIRLLEPGRVVFSSWGLREGLLHAALPDHVNARDPLLDGAAAHAERHGVRAEVAAALAQWTASAAACTDPARERLRLASSMLALALVNLEPNLRADLGVVWALRKRWIGVTTRERGLLAACLMAGGNRLDLPMGWRSLAPAEDFAEAQGWGLATRLCRRLTGTAPAALAATSLTREGGRLILAAEPAYSALVNEAARRDLKALALHLGLKAEVRLD
ncbi:exopolyphosphatase [Novosphingobium flavum]|uniref:Exopolyphosphatase n=1 Tax=Novosphingobium flavum TaxID=1778672 RepID=A0A7X1FU57_9SPHN|nr:exopolyphosphatase [Novosphingobium flavum]MBC2667036.1 exopolyphosphatase [Novosphingobium flavum]